MVDWTCLACGAINKTRFSPQSTWTVRCSHCRKRWGYGSVLYDLPAGGRHYRPPHDVIMHGGMFSAARGTVNRVLCESCARVIIEAQSKPTDPVLPVTPTRRQRQSDVVDQDGYEVRIVDDDDDWQDD